MAVIYRVSSGVFSSGIELNEKDYLYVLDGGVNSSAVVNSGGMLVVSSGGSDTMAAINSEGMAFIRGTADYAEVNEGGQVTVSNGGEFRYGSVAWGGSVEVLGGGAVVGGNVSSGGKLIVSSGAVASGVRVSSGGYLGINLASDTQLQVTSGNVGLNFTMFASGITLDSTKDMNIYNNASANTLRVNVNGNLNVYAGGSANIVEVTNGGQVTVASKGIANRIDIKSGGLVDVEAGGLVERTTVSGGKSLKGSLGVAGSAWNTNISSGGLAVVYGNGLADSSYIVGGTLVVMDNGRINVTRVESDGVLLMSDGQADNTSVGRFGSMGVFYDATASNTKLGSSAYLEVGSGGRVDGFTAEHGALLGFHVDSNSFISGTSDGQTVIMFDGRLADLVYSGNLWVHKGGVAENITVISGGGSVYNGGTASNLTLKDTLLMLGKGGSITSGSIHSGGMLLASGGVVEGMVVSSGAELVTQPAAVMSNVQVRSNAQIYAYTGTTLNNVQIDIGGYINGLRAQVSNNLSGSFNMSGVLVSRASNSLVLAESAYLLATQSAADVVVSGGLLQVESGAKVYDRMVVSNGGSVEVFEGGVISGGALNSDYTAASGSIQVLTGGKVLLFGGVAENMEIAGGEVDVQGNVTSVTVSSGGVLNVGVSGNLSDAVVLADGSVNLTAEAGLAGVTGLTGALLNGFKLNSDNTFDGSLIISGATATDGAVLYAGQAAYDVLVGDGVNVLVTESGVLGDVAFTGDGKIMIDFNSKLTGNISFIQQDEAGVEVENGEIFVQGGGIVEFNIVDRSLLAGELLDCLDRVTGAPEFVISLTADQRSGSYQLAGRASQLENIICSNVDENWTLELGVNKKTVYHGDVGYVVENYGGNLNVTVKNGLNFISGDFGQGVMWGALDRVADAASGEKSNTLSIYESGKINYSYDENNAIVVDTEKAPALWSSSSFDGNLLINDIGDWNGDGLTDLICRDLNSTKLYAGISDGNGAFDFIELGDRGDKRFAGIGDFDGDGSDEILLADESHAGLGIMYILQDNKGEIAEELYSGFDKEWEIVSVGDFDGNGTDDILWKNSFIGEDGNTWNVFCSDMKGNLAEGVNAWQMVSVANPADWKFLASGDFNGDGTDDIALSNGQGAVGLWSIENGTTAKTAEGADQWNLIGVADVGNYVFAGVGDYNNDGTDDIAWSNLNGNAGYWVVVDGKVDMITSEDQKNAIYNYQLFA